MTPKEPRPLPEPEVYTAIEAAAFLATNVDEITRMLRAGELRGWRTRGGPNRQGDWRVARSECLRWAAEQEAAHQRTHALGEASPDVQVLVEAERKPGRRAAR